jgi:CO/xanthine dehydrogenase Mo-binding subunit
MSDQGIGASVRRKEDFRFLTGAGNYTDDINRPGQLYAYILRSPHAHAEIVRIDTSNASGALGVTVVFTGVDLEIGGLPCGWLVNSKDSSPMVEPPHPVLAKGKVRHVGDPVAVVIAETLQQAKDAAELIEVLYNPLPAVVTSGRSSPASRSSSRTHPTTSALIGIWATRRRSKRLSPGRTTSRASTSSITGLFPTRWSRAPRSANTTALRATTRCTRPARIHM